MQYIAVKLVDFTSLQKWTQVCIRKQVLVHLRSLYWSDIDVFNIYYCFLSFCLHDLIVDRSKETHPFCLN